MRGEGSTSASPASSHRSTLEMRWVDVLCSLSTGEGPVDKVTRSQHASCLQARLRILHEGQVQEVSVPLPLNSLCLLLLPHCRPGCAFCTRARCRRCLCGCAHRAASSPCTSTTRRPATTSWEVRFACCLLGLAAEAAMAASSRAQQQCNRAAAWSCDWGTRSTRAVLLQRPFAPQHTRIGCSLSCITCHVV